MAHGVTTAHAAQHLLAMRVFSAWALSTSMLMGKPSGAQATNDQVEPQAPRKEQR